MNSRLVPSPSIAFSIQQAVSTADDHRQMVEAYVRFGFKDVAFRQGISPAQRIWYFETESRPIPKSTDSW